MQRVMSSNAVLMHLHLVSNFKFRFSVVGFSFLVSVSGFGIGVEWSFMCSGSGYQVFGYRVWGLKIRVYFAFVGCWKKNA